MDFHGIECANGKWFSVGLSSVGQYHEGLREVRMLETLKDKLADFGVEVILFVRATSGSDES
jgi:hypothetical protein